MQQKLIMMMFERVVCSLGCFVAYFNEIEIVGKIDVGTNALATELFYPPLFCTLNVQAMLYFLSTVAHSYVTFDLS